MSNPSISSIIQKDWEERETVEVIALGVLKMAKFLNEFNLSVRFKLSKLNERLASLERMVEACEAAAGEKAQVKPEIAAELSSPISSPPGSPNSHSQPVAGISSPRNALASPRNKRPASIGRPSSIGREQRVRSWGSGDLSELIKEMNLQNRQQQQEQQQQQRSTEGAGIDTATATTGISQINELTQHDRKLSADKGGKCRPPPPLAAAPRPGSRGPPPKFAAPPPR